MVFLVVRDNELTQRKGFKTIEEARKYIEYVANTNRGKGHYWHILSASESVYVPGERIDEYPD